MNKKSAKKAGNTATNILNHSANGPNPHQQQQSMLLNFRRAFTIIVVLNFILLVERSIFDFMGFMFGMIIADMIYLILLIVGLFGAYQYRVNYVAMLTSFTLIWIAWNIFVICNYLNVGFLDRYNPAFLNLNTGRKSWWFTQSVGCRKEISNELEQLHYQKQLDEIKRLIEPWSSTTTTTTTTAKTIATTTAYILSHYFNSNVESSLSPFNRTISRNSSSSSSSSSKSNNATVLNSISLSKILTSTGKAVVVDPSTIADSDKAIIVDTANGNRLFLDAFVRANCLVPFFFIEIMHAAVQIIVSIFCVIFGLLLANTFNDDDDTFDYIGGFDTLHIISNDYPQSKNNINRSQENYQTNNFTQLTAAGGGSVNQASLQRNGQIRLEPIYVFNN